MRAAGGCVRPEVMKRPWALPQDDVHVSQVCVLHVCVSQVRVSQVHVSQVRVCQVHVCPTCMCLRCACVSGMAMLTQMLELFQLSTSNVCALLCIHNI